MAKKVLTDEEIQAKKHVDQSLIVELDGKEFMAIKNPRGKLKKKGKKYLWDFFVNGELTLSCHIKHDAAEDARQHCRRIMGIAWNFEVEMEVAGE